MIKIIISMIAGAAILFFVFATIGTYKAVLDAEKKYKELEKLVNYEYERGYGDGFRDGIKSEKALNPNMRGETE